MWEFGLLVWIRCWSGRLRGGLGRPAHADHFRNAASNSDHAGGEPLAGIRRMCQHLSGGEVTPLLHCESSAS